MRDGLQSIAEIMPTEVKLAWLDAEYAAGVRDIAGRRCCGPRARIRAGAAPIGGPSLRLPEQGRGWRSPDVLVLSGHGGLNAGPPDGPHWVEN